MVELNSVVCMPTVTFNFGLYDEWEMVSVCFYLHLHIVGEVRHIFICSLAILISSNKNFPPIILCSSGIGEMNKAFLLKNLLWTC